MRSWLWVWLIVRRARYVGMNNERRQKSDWFEINAKRDTTIQFRINLDLSGVQWINCSVLLCHLNRFGLTHALNCNSSNRTHLKMFRQQTRSADDQLLSCFTIVNLRLSRANDAFPLIDTSSSVEFWQLFSSRPREFEFELDRHTN